MTSWLPTEKQREALKLLTRLKYIMLFGGSRSGKTFIACRAIIIRALKFPSRHLIVRQKFNHAKTSIWADTLPKVLSLTCAGLPVNFNKTDFYIELPNGSQIWVSGTDDKDRIEKVLGNEYATIYANECSQISYDAITLLTTRLAQKTGLDLKFYYDCNPPSKRHWIHRLFIEGVDPQSREEKNMTNYGHLLMNPKDNIENLPDDYISDTLAGLPKRQRDRFLEGKFQSDVMGALWEDGMISDNRVINSPEFTRIVVAIDPPVTSGEAADECGIVVAGIGKNKQGYIIADKSSQGLSPAGWAKIAVDAYHEYKADRIIAEVNNGGELVESVIRQIDPDVSYRAVRASRGKVTRAEPVAALYEQNKIHHIGVLNELEDQMCEFTIDFDKKAMGYSPDRVDALVWALTELMLAAQPAAPLFGTYGNKT